MGSLAAFDIDLKNLKEEKNVFQFKLDNDFFREVNGSEVEDGDLTGTLRVEKTGSVFALDFQAEGYVSVACDRCLESMRQPVTAQGNLCARFGSEYAEEDDVVIVPVESGILNVAWHFYEFVALAVPARHVHAEGECNAEMLARLREWTVEEGERQPQTDPRWKDLEKLKTIIKD